MTFLVGNGDCSWSQLLELEVIAALPGDASILWPLKRGELRLSCDALGGERQMGQLGESNKDLRPSPQFGVSVSLPLPCLTGGERMNEADGLKGRP